MADVPRGFRRILIAPCLVLLVVGTACGSGDSISGVVKVNEPLPRLAGKTLEGDRLDASAHADGSVLVINVWADWCGPCRKEQPQLVRLADRYQDEVRFLGINYQDDRDAARAWVEEFGVPYPSLYDPAGRTAAELGYTFLPDTYVVDRVGRIRWVVFGASDEQELQDLIDDVLG